MLEIVAEPKPRLGKKITKLTCVPGALQARHGVRHIDLPGPATQTAGVMLTIHYSCKSFTVNPCLEYIEFQGP